jgi:hypothetical protein
MDLHILEKDKMVISNQMNFLQKKLGAENSSFQAMQVFSPHVHIRATASPQANP